MSFLKSNPVYRNWVFELPNNDWAVFGMPRGTMLSLHYHVPPQDGDLVLVLMNDCLMMARWFSRVAGFSWLVEPGRAIRIVRRSLVVVLGVLTPMTPFVAF